MTEKEQIRKMAQFFCRHCESGICKFDLKECDMACKWGLNANGLFNAGYRKVSENAVILTPEERDEEMKAYNEERAEFENEIYRLKIQLEQANAGIVNCSGCKLVEINAVKEFAEKLEEYPLESKNLVWEYGEGWLDCYKAVKKAIDDLLKEYEK